MEKFLLINCNDNHITDQCLSNSVEEAKNTFVSRNWTFTNHDVLSEADYMAELDLNKLENSI